MARIEDEQVGSADQPRHAGWAWVGWLGGFDNAQMRMFGAHLSDGYVGKFGLAGNLVSERTYPGKALRDVQSLLSLPEGELAVTGRDAEATYLAKLAPGGEILWEHHFGNGTASAVAGLPGGRIGVVALERSGTLSEHNQQDHVAIWIFAAEGQLEAHRRIREGIRTGRWADYGHVSITASGADVYVTSSWSDNFAPNPVEVVKIAGGGTIVWRRMLPDTISAEQGRPTYWHTCNPAAALLPGGDLLLACGPGAILGIYRLDQIGGDVERASLPLPECNQGHSAALFLSVRRDGTTLLFGSRPPGNFGESCTWGGSLAGAY